VRGAARTAKGLPAASAASTIASVASSGWRPVTCARRGQLKSICLKIVAKFRLGRRLIVHGREACAPVRLLWLAAVGSSWRARGYHQRSGGPQLGGRAAQVAEGAVEALLEPRGPCKPSAVGTSATRRARSSLVVCELGT
jgi:hypothetical protein